MLMRAAGFSGGQRPPPLVPITISSGFDRVAQSSPPNLSFHSPSESDSRPLFRFEHRNFSPIARVRPPARLVDPRLCGSWFFSQSWSLAVKTEYWFGTRIWIFKWNGNILTFGWNEWSLLWHRNFYWRVKELWPQVYSWKWVLKV